MPHMLATVNAERCVIKNVFKNSEKNVLHRFTQVETEWFLSTVFSISRAFYKESCILNVDTTVNNFYIIKTVFGNSETDSFTHQADKDWVKAKERVLFSTTVVSAVATCADGRATRLALWTSFTCKMRPHEISTLILVAVWSPACNS